MRLNKYTLTIENGDSTILYNLITKVLIEIQCKKNELQDEFINVLESDEIEFYKERLLISEDDNDDVNEMMEIKESYNNQSDVGRFMIHMGYSCNLKCTYCYQTTICNESKKNSLSVDDVIKFIQNVSLDNDFQMYDICFIGGEPLLYWKQIIELSEKINASISKDKKIIYSVVTNGTLLDEKHGLSRLMELGVRDYQITIDGIREDHDKHRNNGKIGSFDTIIRNIKTIIKEFPDAFLSINCNLSQDNCNKIGDLFAFLSQNNIFVPVFFSMIFDNGKNIAMEYHTHNTIWRDAHIIGLKNHQKYDPFYRDLFLGCALTQKNYYVIGADGNLYKCINAIDNEDYLVCHINQYNTPKYIERMNHYMSYEPDCNECINCELYPICFGGCEYRNRLSGFECEKNMFYENEMPIIREIVNAGSM